jgi:plasmid stabilization system protein ParE
MSDREDSPLPLPATPEYSLILDAARRTARSIADLALAIEASENKAKRRHDEIMSEAISLGAEIRMGRERETHLTNITNGHSHGEDSTKIILPDGEKFEISRANMRTFWKVAKVVLALLAAGGGWIIHLIYEVKTLGK